MTKTDEGCKLQTFPHPATLQLYIFNQAGFKNLLQGNENRAPSIYEYLYSRVPIVLENRYYYISASVAYAEAETRQIISYVGHYH